MMNTLDDKYAKILFDEMGADPRKSDFIGFIDCYRAAFDKMRFLEQLKTLFYEEKIKFFNTATSFEEGVFCEAVSGQDAEAQPLNEELLNAITYLINTHSKPPRSIAICISVYSTVSIDNLKDISQKLLTERENEVFNRVTYYEKYRLEQDIAPSAELVTKHKI